MDTPFDYLCIASSTPLSATMDTSGGLISRRFISGFLILTLASAPVVGQEAMEFSESEAPRFEMEARESSPHLQVAKSALQFLGEPYTWSGASPGEGFDSSGFVFHVFKMNDYPIPRLLDRQINESPRLNVTQLQVGDLLYFSSETDQGGAPVKVGIFLGDDSFVHSSRAAGAVVVSRLTDDVYQKAFWGGVRILPGTPDEDLAEELEHYKRGVVSTVVSYPPPPREASSEYKEPVLKPASETPLPYYGTRRSSDYAYYTPPEDESREASEKLKTWTGEMFSAVELRLEKWLTG